MKKAKEDDEVTRLETCTTRSKRECKCNSGNSPTRCYMRATFKLRKMYEWVRVLSSHVQSVVDF